MGIAGKHTPPNWKKDAVATNAGWCHRVTGEVLKCYSGLATLQGAPNVQIVELVNLSLAIGDEILVDVLFEEAVNVTAGATLAATATNNVGATSSVTLTAVAQLAANKVRFKTGVVPALCVSITIGAQTISGTIVDLQTLAAGKVISAPQATAAGIAVIPHVLSATLTDLTLHVAQEIVVNILFNEAVNVTAGATIVATSVDGMAATTPVTLTALAQLDAKTVVFGTGVVPAGSVSVHLATQTIGGTIVNQHGKTALKVISAAQATAAGTASVS